MISTAALGFQKRAFLRDKVISNPLSRKRT
jgi:hypothetical protein